MTLAMKALLWVAVSFLLMALVLFLPAGTIAWPAGWIDLILLHGWLLVGIWLLLKYNPGLLEERINLSQSNQKSLGQGVYLAVLPVLLCLAGADAARRCEISLVAGASCAPSGRGSGSGRLVLSHLPDLSGKLIPVANSAYSGRAGTNGDIHWALSLCAPPYVCRWSPSLSRNVPAAGVLVRLVAGPGHDTRGRGASRPGGTRVARGIARL